MTIKWKKFYLFRGLVSAVVFLGWGVAFSSFVPYVAILFGKLAFIPALLSLNASVVSIFFLTLLVGRVYCSIVCPMGILQDVIYFFCRRKGGKKLNIYPLRLIITVFSVTIAICGSAVGFMYFDPYSNFGRGVGHWSLASVVLGILIILIVFGKERFFCNNLCPAGTLLGMASHFSLLVLSFKKECVKCGKCATVCPANCIDYQNGKVDNAQCLRCLKCINSCPLKTSALGFRVIRKRDIDFSRRNFLINGSILLGTLIAGITFAKSGVLKFFSIDPKMKILPPGVGNLKRFSAKCTNCQLCVKNCPQKIIAGNAGGVVSLDMRKGFCSYNCRMCSQICPTGAIKKLTLAEKQKIKIASAFIDYDKCSGCMKCVKDCPIKAINIRKKVPQIKESACIGCGACLHICPENAIYLENIDEQIIIK